ncbi:hypothetical protein MRB53_038297 [Persea americana]|nr:hypothetical protein MRB53_038297 [Persea americana]
MEKKAVMGVSQPGQPSTVPELDALLQGLSELKPPGITKSRIASITAFCTENIKSEVFIVLKIRNHSKCAPATHKLGLIYILDSVTRQWLANAAGSEASTQSSQSTMGTFTSGVRRMTEILPELMTDLIALAPSDQLVTILSLLDVASKSLTITQEKISKLLVIWGNGATFPATLLSDLQKKLTAHSSAVTGGEHAQPVRPMPTTVPVNDLRITSAASPAVKPAPSATQIASISSQKATAVQSRRSLSTARRYCNRACSNIVNAAEPHNVNNAILQQPPQVLSNVIETAPAPPPSGSLSTTNGITAAQLEEADADECTPEQWSQIVDMHYAIQAQAALGSQPQPVENKSSYGARERSRSPVADRNTTAYDTNGSITAYRQRSPVRERISPKNDNHMSMPTPKWIGYDASLPADTIKGERSRNDVQRFTTRELFARYGTVQTCIANSAKMHAFIKMQSRKEAEDAKAAFEHGTHAGVRHVKWAVGFGPKGLRRARDGISTIPLSRLTDADRKWMLTADYGGTGGQPITSGMVVEEPDVIVGAGVSSKGMLA